MAKMAQNVKIAKTAKLFLAISAKTAGHTKFGEREKLFALTISTTFVLTILP